MTFEQWFAEVETLYGENISVDALEFARYLFKRNWPAHRAALHLRAIETASNATPVEPAIVLESLQSKQ